MSLMMSDGLEKLGFLLHDATRLMRRRFDLRAAAHGLSSAQWRLLARLVKEEGATQARLSELLEIEPISVSRLIDRMEEGGWVERRADPADRRARNVYATAKGRAAFETVKSIAGDVFEQALAGVPSADRAVLIRCLTAIAENLSADEAQAATPASPLKGAA
jgi:MarR family transcriptional regulator, transcriptional regulator for hemolysin